MKNKALIGGFFMALAAACVLQAAGLSGKWNATREHRALVQLSLKTGTNNNSFRIQIAQLPELRKAWDANDLHVSFHLTREAGTILFTGTLEGDEGAGDFEFQPSPDFSTKMAGLGYAGLSEREMYQMTLLDVSTAYVKELAGAGYSGLTKSQLMEMRIFSVDSEFINGLRSRGYDGLPESRLVEMKIHGADLDFIDSMKALGYAETPERLVEFRIHGVSPDFVDDMKQLGYSHLPAERLVEFRIHGVTPAFIRGIQDEGYRNVSAKELVEMRIHGVDRAFIQKAKNRVNDPSIREILNMRILGR